LSGEAVSLIAGLFGKLPAHGDFVQRGWPQETVSALDEWLTEGLAAERADLDDDAFAVRMSAGPMWQGYLPPGTAGPLAMHLALAPSIDKAGRYFFLTSGVAGPAAAVWAQASQAPAFAASLENAMYDALASALDAETLLATVTEAVQPPDARAEMLAGVALPSQSAWWIDAPEPVLLRSERNDTILLAQLLDGGTA
jgi:type VI secretion system protein ImpM